MHCAAADFEIHSGVMQHALFLDSEPVFISGEGRVLLDSETVDLKRTANQRLRILRIKAPVLVQGTLLQPKFSVGAAESGLRLVDRGRRTMPDCAALYFVKLIAGIRDGLQQLQTGAEARRIHV